MPPRRIAPARWSVTWVVLRPAGHRNTAKGADGGAHDPKYRGTQVFRLRAKVCAARRRYDGPDRARARPGDRDRGESRPSPKPHQRVCRTWGVSGKQRLRVASQVDPRSLWAPSEGEEHHRCRNDFRLDPRQAERRPCDRLPPTGRNRAMLNVAKHDFKSQEDRCDVVAFGLQIF